MEAAKSERQGRPGASFTIDCLLFNQGKPPSQAPELVAFQKEAGEKPETPRAEAPEAPGSTDLSDKPNQSYIALISNAILSSPRKKLLLSDIYQWIMDRYPYFKNKEKSWRNSVRHNLSLNECFVKVGHSNNGKGHFWAIHPDNLEDFSKGIYHRRAARRGIRRMAVNLSSHHPYKHELSCNLLGRWCLSCSSFPSSPHLNLPGLNRPLVLLPSSVSRLHPFLAGGSGEKAQAEKTFGCWGSSSYPQITPPSWTIQGWRSSPVLSEEQDMVFTETEDMVFWRPN